MNKNIFITSAISIVSVFSLAVGINFFSQDSNQDPLNKYIENSFSKNLKGDFITNSIHKYDGPISSKVKECMNDISMEKSTKKVNATFNSKAIINQDSSEILEDINPVLGHAVKGQQINWEWDSYNREYTFITYENDEIFWKCYFKEDTTFFKEFFIPESIIAQGEVISIKYPIYSFNSFSSKVATSEGVRGIEIDISESEESKEIELGYFNIEPYSRNIKNSFFDSIENNSLIIKDFKPLIGSTNEVVQNIDYPFLNIIVKSSNELERQKIIESIDSIKITNKTQQNEENYKNYLTTISIKKPIAKKSEYQLFIDIEQIPKFYNSKTNEDVESKFIGSNESIILSINSILLDPLKKYFPDF
jgi:hypothetical protein